MNYHRHGEVGIYPAKLPKGAKLVESGTSLIVGHSESGHHHVLTIPNVKERVIKMYELDGQTYLDIPAEAKLSHQKTGTEIHKTQVIAPGIYKRSIKRAYSYADKVMKQVLD